MLDYRAITDKARSVITNIGTALSFASFPWSNAYTVVVALISAAIAVLAAVIGSIPVWAIPVPVLITTFAFTGSMLLLVRKKVVYVASQYKQLEHDNQHLRQALENVTGEVNAATRDRDTALKDLVICWKRFAYSKLSRIAEILNRDTDGVINVDVRFAALEDQFLATTIRDIIELHAHWPVTLDGSNKPAIEPNNDCKVLFESDLTFAEIANVFKSENLLDDVSVGVRFTDLLEDRHRLVVTVSPSVLGAKETISQTLRVPAAQGTGAPRDRLLAPRRGGRRSISATVNETWKSLTFAPP